MLVPVPTNENERLEALHQTDILETAAEDAYDDISRLIAHLCGVPIAAVSLVDAERQWFKSIVGLDVRETPREIAFCAHTILQPDLMVVPDARADPRFSDNPLVTGDPNIRFYAGAPLVTQDGFALGSLCVIDRVPRQLTAPQEMALRLLARLVTQQLETARYVAAQERMIAERERDQLERARLAAIVESSEDSIASIDLEGTITSWNKSLARATAIPASQAIGRHVSIIATPDQVALIDLNNARMRRGEVIEPTEIETLTPDGSRSYVMLTVSPIWDTHGNLIGSSSITRDITARKEAEQRLQEYAVLLEFQKNELEKANADLVALATTDGLTGLLNHRAFQERLAEEVSWFDRYGTPLSLIMLDVDCFKQYNDAYGHPAGDEVLRGVACLMQQVSRQTDIAVRYGGEEFALILPHTNRREAILVAERIRRAIEEAPWPLRGITISIGIATLNTMLENRSDLIARADAALYRSKAAGRNCITHGDLSVPAQAEDSMVEHWETFQSLQDFGAALSP